MREKKKVFVMAYARENLGDDLFLHMLIKRYPEIDFYINIPDKDFCRAVEKFDNVNIFIKDDKDTNLLEFNVRTYDAYVYIGGSIFMEGGKVYNLSNDFNKFMKDCKNNNIPFFYVSSNFGPYRTQEYFDLARDTFANCANICFRDTYSYELFKDIDSVQYAPDLVFQFDDIKEEKIKNTVGISVIDFSIRDDLKPKKETYYQMLLNNINNYVADGKEVYLFSYCKHEGDERAINELLELIPQENLSKVNKVFYSGNVEEFISLYSKMEYMICSRFHAMILSVLYKQKYVVLSYSKKINNVIEDLNLPKNYIMLHDIDSNYTIDETMFEAVKDEILEEIKEQAKGQLSAFDQWYKSVL